jgi:effector-binding domain-containing protein
MSAYDVIVKQVEPQLVASIRSTIPTYNQIGTLYDELIAALGSQISEVKYNIAIWYDEEYKDHDVDAGAAMALNSRVPENGRMRVHDLPAALMATTVHKGTYATLPEAHGAIFQWMESNGYRVVGPVREVYLYNTMPVRQDDPSYVTEIQVPVEKVIAA